MSLATGQSHCAAVGAVTAVDDGPDRNVAHVRLQHALTAHCAAAAHPTPLDGCAALPANHCSLALGKARHRLPVRGVKLQGDAKLSEKR